MSFQYGPLSPTLPEGCVPKEQWSEFTLNGLPPAWVHPEAVGVSPKGLRWRLWPIVFEEYVSDLEPVLSDSDPHNKAHNRITLWRRISRTDQPNGWHTTPFSWGGVEGFAKVEHDYWKRWDESARRSRKKWLTHYFSQTYTVEEISYDAFKVAYSKSMVARRTSEDAFRATKQMQAVDPSLIRYIGAIRNTDNSLQAGIALVFSPTTKNAYYVSGFYQKETSDAPLMIGLMDYWFSESLKNNYLWLHLGQFYKKGEPKSWKGFSTFKAKLHPVYVEYKPLLWRFVRGRFW